MLQTRLITVEEFETVAVQPSNRARNLELIHGEIAERLFVK